MASPADRRAGAGNRSVLGRYPRGPFETNPGARSSEARNATLHAALP